MQGKKALSSRGQGRLRGFLELQRPWGFSPEALGREEPPRPSELLRPVLSNSCCLLTWVPVTLEALGRALSLVSSAPWGCHVTEGVTQNARDCSEAVGFVS